MSSVFSQNETYSIDSSVAAMQQIFHCDLFAFELRDTGKIIAERAPHCRSRLKDSFFEVLPLEERRKLLSHIRQYSSEPIELSGALGKVLVLPFLIYEASLGIAVLPHNHKDATRELDELCQWSRQALALPLERAEESLLSYLHQLSLTVGVPCTCFVSDQFLLNSQAELARLLACTLVVLMFYRRASISRDSVCWLAPSGEDLSLVFRCSVIEPPMPDDPAIEWLNELAQKQHTDFHYLLDGQVLSLQILLRQTELPMVGIKEPIHIPFLEED